MGEDQLKVADFVFGWNERFGFLKPRVGFDQLVDFFEVGQVVGRGVEFSAGLERTGKGIHKQFIENAVVVVFPFRPRVGIENIIGVHALRRHEIGDGIIAIQA